MSDELSYPGRAPHLDAETGRAPEAVKVTLDYKPSHELSVEIVTLRAALAAAERQIEALKEDPVNITEAAEMINRQSAEITTLRAALAAAREAYALTRDLVSQLQEQQADIADAIWAKAKAQRCGNPEDLARRFHEVYERLAPSFGYETRTETHQFDPTTPNGRLMIAVCGELVVPQGCCGNCADWLNERCQSSLTNPVHLRWTQPTFGCVAWRGKDGAK